MLFAFGLLCKSALLSFLGNSRQARTRTSPELEEELCFSSIQASWQALNPVIHCKETLSSLSVLDAVGHMVG